jgi:phytoene dehydrogenase-like protein
MQKKKVIVIGAGLSGMSAASYLQMNGFDTEIFEMSNYSGGLCSSWKRGDYLIDGCIHFMVGTSESESTFKFWNGLIDMKNVDFVYYNNHCSVVDNEKFIYFYSNIDELEKELIQKAPEDLVQINFLISGIRKFINVKLPTDKPIKTMNFNDKLNSLKMVFPFLGKMIKTLKISNKEFVDKLKNPFLKEAFKLAFVDELPIFSTMLTFVWRHNKQMGYPKGGAVKIASLIEENYKNLGGKINYNCKVSKIITEKNQAKGIILENGNVFKSDIVISAADGKTTIYKMLEGKFKDKNIIERYESDIFETIDKTLYVSIGVNKDFSKENHKIYFILKKPIYVDSKTTLNHLEITHYCEDKSAAPEGKSLLTIMPDSLDWEYWFELRKNNISEYRNQKKRIADLIIDALDTQFGDIKNNVEMIDIATPATYIRYTGNWTGGQISWKSKKETISKPIAWNIKGLKNFYMTGQWAGSSGGLNHVVMLGNHLAQIICKNEKVKFVSVQK